MITVESKDGLNNSQLFNLNKKIDKLEAGEAAFTVSGIAGGHGIDAKHMIHIGDQVYLAYRRELKFVYRETGEPVHEDDHTILDHEYLNYQPRDKNEVTFNMRLSYSNKQRVTARRLNKYTNIEVKIFRPSYLRCTSPCSKYCPLTGEDVVKCKKCGEGEWRKPTKEELRQMPDAIDPDSPVPSQVWAIELHGSV